jgi:hypothetical protein
MARHAFVIIQRRQREFRPFVRVAQIDEVRARARAIERRALIITARRARFGRKRRHAIDFQLRPRQRVERARHHRFDLARLLR